MKQLDRFCNCIKSVKRTVKLRRGSKRGTNGARSTYGKEQAAIAICVKSVLQGKGRTLKKFKCRGTRSKKAFLQTQAND
jgi:hypothetical protein